MDSWIAEYRQRGLLEWAVTVVARTWRRYTMRRQVLRYARLRRRMRCLSMRPYFVSWRNQALALRYGNAARLKAAFGAWREYCRLLHQLHVSVIAWGWRAVHRIGGLHLTWTLCLPPHDRATGSGLRPLRVMSWTVLRIAMHAAWA